MANFFEKALGKYLVEADLEDGVLSLTFSKSKKNPVDVCIYTMKLEKNEVLKPLPKEPLILTK